MGQPARQASAFDDSGTPRADPSHLGFRERIVRLAGGRTELRQIPLRAEDLLDLQVEGSCDSEQLHNATVMTTHEMLSWRYESRPAVLVTGDLKMIWEFSDCPAVFGRRRHTLGPQQSAQPAHGDVDVIKDSV